jgi:DNA-directed RNA polymerase subunit RPC12/RpoP
MVLFTEEEKQMTEKLSERIKHNLEIGYYAYNSQLLNEVESLEAEVKTLRKEMQTIHDFRDTKKVPTHEQVKKWYARTPLTVNEYLGLMGLYAQLEARLAKAQDWLSNTKPRLAELGTFVTSDEFYELKKALGGDDKPPVPPLNCEKCGKPMDSNYQLPIEVGYVCPSCGWSCSKLLTKGG